jgi:hypothetical protein
LINYYNLEPDKPEELTSKFWNFFIIWVKYFIIWNGKLKI